MKLLFLILFPLAIFGQSTNLIPARNHSIGVVNVTYSPKDPQRLFDNDLTTKMDLNFQKNALATPMTWFLVLDSTYENMKLDYYHTTGGSSWIVRVYSKFNDTSTADRRTFYFGGVFNNWATVSGLDTVSFPIRGMMLQASDPATSVMELKLYGDGVALGSPILPSPVPMAGDPGKYLYGISDLYPDQTYDDAGWSVRWMSFTDYVDTCVFCLPTNHNYVFSKFQNDLTSKFNPTIAAGRKIHPYYEQASEAFKYSPGEGGRNSKDIPKGSDSLDPASWINQYRLSAASVSNFDPEYIEIGNEDPADWVDNLRYHSPGVLLTKWKQAAAGARSAKPTIKVIGGALPYLDTMYLKGMWFLNYLSGDPWPVDGIAINDYTTSSGGQHVDGTDGVSPEQGNVTNRWKAAKSFVDRYNIGLELWQTEFGWDTTETSYNVRPIVGVKNETIKAWLYGRHWFRVAAAGVHRAFAYTNRMQGGVSFGTAGWEYVVEDPPGVFTLHPTELYWHLETIANEISGFWGWPEIIQEGDSTGITVFRMLGVGNDSVLIIPVRGTLLGATTYNYKVNLGFYPDGNFTRSVIVNGTKRGVQTTLVPDGVTVTVPTVHEGVQFLRGKRRSFRPRYASRYNY